LSAVIATWSSALPNRHAAAAQPADPLVLEVTIPLPDVRRRIDHMAVDLARQRLFVAELGNNSVDVVDLSAGRVLHRIANLSEPQGVGYSENADLIFVANAADGTVRLFGGADFTPEATIPLGDDADNIRVDSRTGLIVVGFGDGGLALIDPQTRTKVAAIALPGHPESFRIDAQTGRAFVNIPDAREVAVVDLGARRAIAHWPMRGLGGNFPMALDAAFDRLAVVFRNPPLLALLDPASGAVRAEAKTCGDADDVFFDDRRNRIYISCGAGEVATFQIEGAGVRPLPSTPTAIGARTSLFVPTLDRLFVARRAGPSRSAAILVYRPGT
ncbi:MAG: YncE family protein, partial [Acetobacteraceae bacterium]